MLRFNVGRMDNSLHPREELPLNRPIISLTFLIIGVMVVNIRGAGTNAADEAAIRKLIAAADQAGTSQVPRLPDAIFWSGAYKRPIVGSEKGILGDPSNVENRVSQTSKTAPQRIVVADSRDLAYEYSTGTLEYDLKNGQHKKTERALLRVWQKQNGEWKQAAVFLRPFDE